jgi:hypothetical protein
LIYKEKREVLPQTGLLKTAAAEEVLLCCGIKKTLLQLTGAIATGQGVKWLSK